jgi:uncharacterized membrane protein YcaP (DUF421 family)
MNELVSIDWGALFIPKHSLAEMVVRGTLMYLALFIIFRFVLQRQAGAFNLADLLVVVVIADAAQNAFSRTYESFTEGVVLVLTIVFCDFALDWLAYHFKFFARLTQPPPVPLVENGNFLWRNMRAQMITRDELLSHIRQQGLADISNVKSARLESNGEISVIERGKRRSRPRPTRNRKTI